MLRRIESFAGRSVNRIGVVGPLVSALLSGILTGCGGQQHGASVLPGDGRTLTYGYGSPSIQAKPTPELPGGNVGNERVQGPILNAHQLNSGAQKDHKIAGAQNENFAMELIQFELVNRLHPRDSLTYIFLNPSGGGLAEQWRVECIKETDGHNTLSGSCNLSVGRLNLSPAVEGGGNVAYVDAMNDLVGFCRSLVMDRFVANGKRGLLIVFPQATSSVTVFGPNVPQELRFQKPPVLVRLSKISLQRAMRFCGVD